MSRGKSQKNKRTGKGKKAVRGMLKAALWAGAGFTAARALRRSQERSTGGGRPPAPVLMEPRPTAPMPEPDPESTLESLWIPGPSGSLHLLRGPSTGVDAGGLPVLFLHGLGGSAEHWRPLLDALPHEIHGVALDLPGHGRSDPMAPGTETFTMQDLAAAVGAVADGLGWRHFLLVGHSLGAAVAGCYAGRHGARVAGLLLVDPNGDQSRIPEDERRSVLDAVAAEAHEELGWHYRRLLDDCAPETGERVLQDLKATAPEVLHRSLAASFEYGPLNDLDAYVQAGRGPVRCILSPDNDVPFSLHRLRPDLQVAILRSAGHWMMLDDPDALIELLDPFLEATQPRIH